MTSQMKAPKAESVTYVARLCWNSEGWTHPTGESAAAEHGTYATRVGYGHKEWLFNYQWILNGWKYGFLQPVNRSYAKFRGRTISVVLYTISPAREWFYVGGIPACEVLTEDQAEEARTAFRKHGWLRDMEAQAKQVGGSVKGLRYPAALGLFNVRFRPEAVDLHDRMLPVGERDTIRRYRRYTLVPLPGRSAILVKEWRARIGTTKLRRTGKQIRAAANEVEANLVESQLQNELFLALRKRFGANAVVMEEGFADVKLRREGVVDLVEVKATPHPAKAIRAAIGQLIQYAFRSEQEGDRVGMLAVAAPGELRDPDREFLRYVQKLVGLPVEYICLRRGFRAEDFPEQNRPGSRARARPR